MSDIIHWIEKKPRMSGSNKDYSFLVGVILLSLAAFGLVFAWNYLPTSWSRETGELTPEMQQLHAMDEQEMRARVWPNTPETVEGSQPRLSSRSAIVITGTSFEICGSGKKVTCVADGDTLWYKGTRIQIADINAPSISRPACDREAELGVRAGERLAELLNAGPFSFHSADRTYDRSRSRLLLVARSGRSLGVTMIDEGLANPAGGSGGGWCTA